MAPHEKVFVGDDFREDENHGSIACAECHGGNPESADFKTAHAGVVKDPSYPTAGVCAKCHDNETAHYKTSLHYSLAPMREIIMQRGGADPEVKAKLNQAFGNHCASCHSSCGQCHVSRPNSVGGGFLAGHKFEKTAPVKESCTACHGSRVGDEFFGKTKGCTPDVHRQKAFMKCQKCHTGKEMHGDGKKYPHRLEVANGPKCVDCHADIYSAKGQNRSNHEQHKGKVACQVCHSQPYQNCFGCHVGQSKSGQAFFKLDKHRYDFKIGLNPKPSPRRPEKFVTLRHAPIAPDTFAFYLKGDLKDFNRLPTWKPATPHNIQRRTEQNISCNNCHGNSRLFLSEKDVDPAYRAANQPVIVPAKLMPKSLNTPPAKAEKDPKKK